MVKFTTYENGVLAIVSRLAITLYYDKPYLEWSYGVFNSQEARIYFKDIISVSFSKGGFFSDATFSISTTGKTYHAKLIGEEHNLDELAQLIEGCKDVYCKSESDNSSKVSGADELLKYKELLDQGIISQAEFDAKKKQILGL